MATILGKRETASTARDAPRVPKSRNMHDFVLTAHPQRWVWSIEDREAGHSGWLPSLGRINRVSGCGGVGANGELDLAIVQSQGRGNVVILPHDRRLGEYAPYTQEFPAYGRVRVFASIFDSVKLVGNRAIWKHDEAGWRTFRRFLIAKGIVPDIDPDIREMLIDDERAKLERAQGRLAASPQNPALARRIDLMLEKIDAMSAPPPKPKPKPKRKPRARKAAAPKAPEVPA